MSLQLTSECLILPCSQHSHSRVVQCRAPAPRCHQRAHKHTKQASCRAATLENLQVESERYVWQGSDEYDDLGDRKDEAPLPLPAIDFPVRVVLVRHGQSTWNAEGRVQGSCNLSVLTDKGKGQAQTTRDLLRNERFDVLFQSPLARAQETAEIIWGDREGEVVELPYLREVDLYSFQGLLKHEGKERFGQQFKTWQKAAALFELDNHAPIRELWYRASVAWQEMLGQYRGSTILLVAHNAVNQALVCTALGLPPVYFRRLLQSNAATTVLDFQPASRNEGTAPVLIDRLNQSPGPPFGAEPAGSSRLVLVRCGETQGTEEGRLLGTLDSPLSPLGDVHGNKAGEFLMDLQVSKLFCSPLKRATGTAQILATYQMLSGSRKPSLDILPELTNRDWGEWDGKRSTELQGLPLHDTVERLDTFWARVGQAWEAVQAACQSSAEQHQGSGGIGHSVVVVTHGSVISAMLCHALGLDQEGLSRWRMDSGGVTVIDFPDVQDPERVVVRCSNYTAHLGRWSVPITNDELEGVCGIDGCF